MSDDSLLPEGAATICLVLAPLCEVVEQLLSPLTGGSTAADLQAITAHQGAFTVSVLIGLIGTVLYVPAFLGLAGVCLSRSRVAARIGGGVAVLSMLGFAGVRMGQAIQLEAVDRHVDIQLIAGLMDGAAGNPIGMTMMIMFLGGTVIGVLALAIATWRAGLPRAAAILLAVFPFVDLAAKGHVGTVVSHVVLLVALGWLASAIARRQRGAGVPVVRASV